MRLSDATRQRLEMLFSGAERGAVASLLVQECGSKLPLWKAVTPEDLDRIIEAVDQTDANGRATVVRCSTRKWFCVA